MIRIHKDNFVPKYQNGKWSWDSKNEKLNFNSNSDDAVAGKGEFVNSSSGFKFRSSMNQIEELIFRQEFNRPDGSHDNDVILIQDIKNLVLFLAPSEIITTKQFVNFIHTRTVDKLLNALIVYFQYFMQLVEFILIRRDEVTGSAAQIQSNESTEIKTIYSQYLSQYRLIIAREYSEILLGNGETKPYYHITPIVNISKTTKDKAFHEAFLAFCLQVVWIAMHRRAYGVIDNEINRLFRSEHFKLPRNEDIIFTKVEKAVLFGSNYKRVNYRAQNSPLIQQIANVAPEDLPVLWIGERKYRGTDLRMHQLELEFLVPGSQLSLIDVTHGILGHPKILYTSMLTLDWDTVRGQNYSEMYDPYRIVRQPYLNIPKIDETKIRKESKQFDFYYAMRDRSFEHNKELIAKWKKRDKIIQYYTSEGLLTNINMKCQREVEDKSYGPSVKEITEKFLEIKQKLRKK